MRVGAVDREQIDARRHATAQGLDALGEQAGHFRDHVGFGEHDGGRDGADPASVRARLHEREVTLEPARVEVIVEAHHQQRGVDVGDDRVAPAVGIAPVDVSARRHACMNPDLAVRIGRGQQPVTDGEHRALGGECAGQAWQHACGQLVGAVVQAHGIAVHFGQAQQFERW